ncbi:MAG: pilus assembly protein N-terminal domain-containing protein, partial [Planctomycetaceae bacterium]|nr:pilus assembly protein N-terminal domain-containing protein [Planctomycetaceae bacterium]
MENALRGAVRRRIRAADADHLPQGAQLWARMLGAACLMASVVGQNLHAQSPVQAPPRLTVPVHGHVPGAIQARPHTPQGYVQPVVVEMPAPPDVSQVQYAAPVATERPLDPRIAAMPVATEQMQVVHHRSQLLITNQQTWRISVTDPSICEVLQYSPTELAVLGIGLGTTDVWLWFEGSNT